LKTGSKSIIGLLDLTFLHHGTISHSFSGFLPDLSSYLGGAMDWVPERKYRREEIPEGCYSM
jgi:hypothetical protein